jgi:hypothetical protein
MRAVKLALAAGLVLGLASSVPRAAAGECAKHNTAIDFWDSPKVAADRAKKLEKLVLVIHVSGVFEDPKLT